MTQPSVEPNSVIPATVEILANQLLAFDLPKCCTDYTQVRVNSGTVVFDDVDQAPEPGTGALLMAGLVIGVVAKYRGKCSQNRKRFLKRLPVVKV